MDEAALVRKLVEPALDALGYELVRVKLSGGDDRRLQIMAERGDRAEMTVDDCATISRSLSSLLDAEDPIPDACWKSVRPDRPPPGRPGLTSSRFRRPRGEQDTGGRQKEIQRCS